jgi:CubicO group peptidase (beta-lactamase class C family)
LHRLARLGFVASLALACQPSLLFAQQAEGVAPSPRIESPPEALPDLETFVDGVVTSALEQHRIGGAQVAIVKDGQTLLVKGYGLAAISPDRPVDPQRSLFRIGSISKTFTWVALMQLAERGVIELEDPVNKHLPDALKVPDEPEWQPVRILDLMNHTSGFEDALQNLFVEESSGLLPLRDHLQRFRPARVREPGRYLAYSNYGAALAGAVVAHVSGMEFERYVEENIFVPLGLTHTTFREEHGADAPEGLPAPMPAEWARDKAQGLEFRDGAWKAYAQEHILAMAPAGSAVSTAADMARYMTALLNPELLERSGVLSRASYERLRQPSFQGAPGLTAVHHGFFNMPLGGKQPLGFDNLSHSGGTLHFQSFMALIPEVHLASGAERGSLGIFVTTNSLAGGVLAQELPEQLLGKYFGASSNAIEPMDQPHALSDYVGQYRGMRRSYTKLEKLFGLMQTIRIDASDDGFLTVATGREPLRMVEIADDLFRQQNGDLLVAFERDANGKVTHTISVAGASERIGFFDTLSWMLAVSVAVLVASVAVLIGAWRRARRRTSQSRHERRSTRCLVFAAVTWLVFWALLVAWGASFVGPDGLDRFMVTYPQALLKVALAALLLAAFATLAAVIALIPMWLDASSTMGRRVRHSAAAAIFLIFTATAAHWNMLGFKFY